MEQAIKTKERSRVIPDKLYFKIGEVAEIIGVKPYVLRYWETEFPEIVPTKSRSQQRLYRKKDVELILQIRELLYEEKFTIAGAKNRLKELSKKGRQLGRDKQMALSLSATSSSFLKDMKNKLVELSEILSKS